MRLLEKDYSALNGFTGSGWAERRILALSRIYEPDCGLVRFYSGEDGSALCVEGDLATLHPAAGEGLHETEEFLELSAGEVLSPVRLALNGFSESSGGCCEHEDFPAVPLEGVTEELQPAYELLSRVFPDSINEAAYLVWYCDLSHRVRHGMSRVFTLPGVCSGTIYCALNGAATVAQLGVAPERRGEGFGRAMLSQLAWACGGMRLTLHSQNEASDRFYEHLGFVRTGAWYYYGRNPPE